MARAKANVHRRLGLGACCRKVRGPNPRQGSGPLDRSQGVEWETPPATTTSPRSSPPGRLSRRTVGSSEHDRLAAYLRGRPRVGIHRWILYYDGPGEIADYVVVEQLATGEVHLGLWHAKASNGGTPAVRVKDFQEVVAQALRSRRQFPSTTLWNELAARLSGQARPLTSLVDGSDDLEVLNRKLGLAEDDDSEPPWTRRYPAVRGTLGIVQPGLSAEAFRAELSENPVPAGAQSLRELFSVLTDMAQSDGAELVLVVSP
jgi:hypothetical protein